MAQEITSDASVIDSRDVIERLEELQAEREHDGDEVSDTSETDDEFEMLTKLAQELEGESEWEHGLALINEDYWVKYCQEMLEDCGDLPKGVPSYIVIDWEATADNLKADYSEVEIGGETFYYRNC